MINGESPLPRCQGAASEYQWNQGPHCWCGTQKHFESVEGRPLESESGADAAEGQGGEILAETPVAQELHGQHGCQREYEKACREPIGLAPVVEEQP